MEEKMKRDFQRQIQILKNSNAKVKEIDINKVNKSITFQNRGIGFTQIGIAGEILDLIDDLQQENKQLDEAITICDILVKSNVEENLRLRKIITRVLKYIDSQTCNMPRNGCSQRLSRIKKMLKEASE